MKMNSQTDAKNNPQNNQKNNEADEAMIEVSEETKAGRMLVGIFNRWQKRIIRAQAETGIDQETIGYGKILGFIDRSEREGLEVCQRDIERHERLNKSTVSLILTVLERKGMVRRESVPGDARRKHIVLTEQGREKGKELRAVFRRVDREVYGVLSAEELENFLMLLDKIERNMESGN